MITLDEIREVAGKVNLQNTVVEKDYALGWLLWGIHQHQATNRDWVFKGGTCLKKCYFETYRFSEDLDFSYLGATNLTVESLTATFGEIVDLIQNESGLEFLKASIQFEIFQNPRGSLSIQGGVKYRGPVRPQVGIQNMPRIKIDLTLDEPLVLAAVIKSVEHSYSDLPTRGISILSYDYEEVFAEKVRALAQRLRPRDLYDVIHLYRRMDLGPDRAKVRATLQSKCQLRKISIPTIAAIETHENRAFLESEWENQLRHQIPVLPDFQSFLSELPSVLLWIEEGDVEGLPSVATETQQAEEEVNDEAVATLVLPGASTSNLDRIRFAAANRLVVRLGYDGSFRDIEPYALSRSTDGNLLLRAIRNDSGDSRSYRFDRMNSVEVIERTFAPRYEIEITSAGHLPVHQLTRVNPGTSRPPTYGRAVRSGPTYVYRCPVCKKLFNKKSMDSALGAHKNKSGRPCYATSGIYVRKK